MKQLYTSYLLKKPCLPVGYTTTWAHVLLHFIDSVNEIPDQTNSRKERDIWTQFQRGQSMAIWSHELGQDSVEAETCGREEQFTLWPIGKQKSQEKDLQVPVPSDLLPPATSHPKVNKIPYNRTTCWGPAKHSGTAACMG